MAESNPTMLVALEKLVSPKIKPGVYISIIGGGLILLFLPNHGLVHMMMEHEVGWLLTVIGVMVLLFGIIIVIKLPAYYRQLNRLVQQTVGEQMRVTLRTEIMRGEHRAFADLRNFDSEADSEIIATIRIIRAPAAEAHSPAKVYGQFDKDPIVIETLAGFAWPEPDEKQRKLEELLRVR